MPSPDGNPSTPSCYLVGEATADWSRLLQKLIQLERALWLLLVRITLLSKSNNKLSPRLPSNFATASPDHVTDHIGMALVCILDSRTEASEDRDKARKAVKAVIDHKSFAALLPLCSKLNESNRLVFLFANHDTDQLVAQALLRSSANSESLKILSAQVRTIGKDVAELKSDVAELKSSMTELLEIGRRSSIQQCTVS